MSLADIKKSVRYRKPGPSCRICGRCEIETLKGRWSGQHRERLTCALLHFVTTPSAWCQHYEWREVYEITDQKRRMKPNPHEAEGYHSREHDEDVTCHETHFGNTPCEPVEEEKNI